MQPLPSLKETIAAHGLSAKKSFGQHFLLDMNITAKIAHAAGELSGHSVIEIGPGPGGLTRALLAAGAEVWAVEKDARCIAALNELAEHYPGKLHILEADALETDLTTLAPAPRKIVSNLPYNVGTPLLIRWLDDMYQSSLRAQRSNPDTGSPRSFGPRDDVAYTSLTLMFQKEVAERIAAAPDTDDYGRLAVISQWLCRVHPRFDLPPGAFSPPPKVHSSVITLTPHAAPLFPAEKKKLERVLASAFGNRRKMLRQSLKSLGVDTEALLAAAGIDGTRRAETLDIEEFCRLARLLG